MFVVYKEGDNPCERGEQFCDACLAYHRASFVLPPCLFSEGTGSEKDLIRQLAQKSPCANERLKQAIVDIFDGVYKPMLINLNRADFRYCLKGETPVFISTGSTENGLEGAKPLMKRILDDPVIGQPPDKPSNLIILMTVGESTDRSCLNDISSYITDLSDSFSGEDDQLLLALDYDSDQPEWYMRITVVGT
jgi:cell division GTPase FtsZ